MNGLRIVTAAVMGGAMLALGCSSVPAPPPDQYFHLATPASTTAAQTPTGEVRIQVETIEANGIYAERPLLFRTEGLQAAIQQYRYDLWAEPPAKMLRDTLVEHLRAQYGAERVWTSEARAHADFSVRGRVRALEQLVQTGAAKAALSLEYVVSGADGEVVTVYEYKEEIPAASTTVADYVAALNQALTRAYAGLDRRLAQSVSAKK